MNDLEQLHALQVLDTAIDQLHYRRAHLEQRTALAEARRSLAALRKALAANEARQQELDRLYGAVEASSAELDTRRARLESKLRTIVITREAEALQREIATVKAERDAADEQGLVLLDESETLAAEAQRLDQEISAAEAVERAAVEALAIAEAEIDAELVVVSGQRADAATAVGPDLVARYEQMRPHFQGVAVARLQGTRCTGCHLDLSRMEIEVVWAAASSGFPECPQCGRLLVA